ncbi:RagB/SusD family nutrient uptake outer membrane protein [Reichenbachiella sp. 5M10]|uniref:RagB/SusD family nutrient uptake outer membrane protein n=1 Tax=Reichenbachiella sp. 5M10 TaxID=1889772 RepID=UPI001304060D|nr:RagB/SusD family nutrient uptake outer membrane protein [Reichenbachiella sp. 5M10]
MIRISKKIAVVTLSLGSLFACTDLDPKIKEFTTGEEYLQESAEALQEDFSLIDNFVEPIYSSLYQWNGERNIYALTEASSDEMVTPTRGTDWYDNGIWVAMHEHKWTPEISIIANGWNDISSGVARCYEVYINLTNMSAEDPNFRADLEPYLAEVRVMRAYYMWQYIDMFGVLPFLDDNLNPDVLNRQDGTAFIIEELEEAIPMMKKKSELPYGRACKQTAQALLAKVYLNRFIYEDRAATADDMDQVIAHCDAVINTGEYSLGSDYFSMFDSDNESSPETLLTLQNSGEVGRGFDSQAHTFMTLHYTQSVNNGQPWNGMCVPPTFFYKWDTDGNPNNGVQTTDSRFQDDRYFDETGLHLGFLFGQQVDRDGANLEDRVGNPLVFTPEIDAITAAGEAQGVRVVKWAPDETAAIPQWMNNDVALIRYADVILMKGEALWRKGDDAGAMTLINQVKTARGAANITSIAASGQEILDERGFEFYWEGHRRTDLIRFDVFTKGTWWAKEVSDEYRKIYPIPVTALSANENLVQNPGY